MRTRPVLVIATAALLALVPSAAFAHHPEIRATQDCDGLVSFSAEAWNEEGATPERRTNNRVVVKILDDGGDKLAEYEGKFTAANGYSFQGEHQLDEPGEVVVKVIAKVKWGPNETFADGGESRRTKLEPPDDDECAATETTGAPGDDEGGDEDEGEGTSVPTSTVGQVAVVGGPPPADAAAADAPGALPFTGPSSTVPLLVGGVGLIVVGMLALRSGRRRRLHGNR